MSELRGGDLCVIVPHPQEVNDEIARRHNVYGKMVVLSHTCDCDRCKFFLNAFPSSGPMWVASRTPYPFHSLCTVSLRKIPPADLGLDVLTEEEVSL